MNAGAIESALKNRRIAEIRVRAQFPVREALITKSSRGITVQFSDKPSEDALDCVRPCFKYNGTYWQDGAEPDAYRAVRELITVLSREGWYQL